MNVRFWRRAPANVHNLSAVVTATGEMPVEGQQLARHLCERALAELDEGDVDGCKQALTRLRGLL